MSKRIPVGRLAAALLLGAFVLPAAVAAVDAPAASAAAQASPQDLMNDV